MTRDWILTLLVWAGPYLMAVPLAAVLPRLARGVTWVRSLIGRGAAPVVGTPPVTVRREPT